MSVYKEFYHAIKLIESNSKRIYEDACDYGALTQVGDELWNWAKQLVEWYGKNENGEKKRTQEDYSTGTTVTSIVSGIDEWITGNTEIYKLTYVSVKKGIKKDGKLYNGFLQIEKIKTIENKNFKNNDL